MKKGIIFLMFLALNAAWVSAQDESNENQNTIGIELQVYPTGIIPGIRLDLGISERSSIYSRIGYQLIDHRDLGAQDMEEGDGYGFSLGYIHHRRVDHLGWSYLIKSDIWWNRIDWENFTPQESGTTDIVVLQPTFQTEYSFDINNGFRLIPSVALGFEWNIKTDGEPTGEGLIFLVGVTIGKVF